MRENTSKNTCGTRNARGRKEKTCKKNYHRKRRNNSLLPSTNDGEVNGKVNDREEGGKYE